MHGRISCVQGLDNVEILELDDNNIFSIAAKAFMVVDEPPHVSSRPHVRLARATVAHYRTFGLRDVSRA